ncbi:hypothetical protein BU14_0416s0009 [Porphyra umbilicalis]|uniref:Uncharacterized protein n=1 Tax=Porphyra umbilicalis TaxID=2786 RepID=A0A1X6NVN9_PORUM|nr:hypothetical protein BU14_0416s0009 [Porphyra umbilicalis]|eukprot:OSX72647.1 hypothetical protein BU14_0416s0009 [Porphyra umbilicalis]
MARRIKRTADPRGPTAAPPTRRRGRTRGRGGVLLPRLRRRPCPSPPDPSSPPSTVPHGHLTPVSLCWCQAVHAGGGPSCCGGASASALPSTPPPPPLAPGSRGNRRPSSTVTGTSVPSTRG